MQLPNQAQAVVPQRKVTDYLLSPLHPDGRSKAAFCRRFGFSASAWEVFADALRRHAADNEVATAEDTPFGTSYTIEGALGTPDGRLPLVRVIWFVSTGESVPRLVTAYPLKRARR